LNEFFRKHIAIIVFKFHVLATSSSLNDRSASFAFEAKALFSLVKIIIHHFIEYKYKGILSNYNAVIAVVLIIYISKSN
jgi:hypothetical protein